MSLRILPLWVKTPSPSSGPVPGVWLGVAVGSGVGVVSPLPAVALVPGLALSSSWLGVADAKGVCPNGMVESWLLPAQLHSMVNARDRTSKVEKHFFICTTLPSFVWV